MCGIIGYIGNRQAEEILMDGLRRLEYRGYDSAGIAIMQKKGLRIAKALGKLSALTQKLSKKHLNGSVGIGHTRWATHGKPNNLNAHPHDDCQGRIAVVHNGIIENFSGLKIELQKQGHKFSSDTDTEVIAHLIEEHYEDDLHLAVQQAVSELEGSFAIAVISVSDPNKIVVCRKDSPLIIGLGDSGNFVASDVPGILDYTRNVVYLEDWQTAVITRAEVKVFSKDGCEIQYKVHKILWDNLMAEKAGFKHFMLKEINEQSEAVLNTIRSQFDLVSNKFKLDKINIREEVLKKLENICIIACGTSYHAGMVGKYLIEELIGIPTQIEVASEYRYRSMIIKKRSLAIVISQSGETADTIAALREVRKKGVPVLAICNVEGSTIMRESDGAIHTVCGPEIGVASTKAFTGQLAALYLLAFYLADLKLNRFPVGKFNLSHLPNAIIEVMKQEKIIQRIARKYFKKSHFLFLGRHYNYPIALEGALKLKEISYIHAEGYPAGEMKHGPIALIDENMPVVVLATNSKVYEKTISNIQEAKTRGGIIIALISENNKELIGKVDDYILIPEVEELFYPILNVIPLQLLAYHIAVLRGCDVDQPRNLAKSVTVE
ncbi:MAG: glutamine--fructose-6-phosphate transaminase (isomerizing) [bacterium]